MFMHLLIAQGLVNEVDNASISTLYDPTPSPPLPYYADATLYILRMRAIAILERSSKLMYLKPEPGWQDRLRETMSTSPESVGVSNAISPPNWVDEYLSVDWAMEPSPEQMNGSRRGSGIGKGWMRTAKIRTPKAYAEVRQALLDVERDLPPERRTEWEIWDGTLQSWHQGPPKKETSTLVSELRDAISTTDHPSISCWVARGCSCSTCSASTRKTT